MTPDARELHRVITASVGERLAPCYAVGTRFVRGATQFSRILVGLATSEWREVIDSSEHVRLQLTY